jgi:hypothetical protein
MDHERPEEVQAAMDRAVRNRMIPPNTQNGPTRTGSEGNR